MSYFTDMQGWHRRFDVPVADHPTALSPDRHALRLTLLAEEYKELVEALESGDLAAAAGEAFDVLAVVLGTMAEAGVPFDAVWAAKLAAIHSKADPDGTIHRRADGKVLKGPYYREADLVAVLAGHVTLPGIRPVAYWEAWCTGDGSGEHQIELGDMTAYVQREGTVSDVDEMGGLILADGRVYCDEHIPADVCPDSTDNRHEREPGDPEMLCMHCDADLTETCQWFRWIGQPFTSCDGCGRPAWVHEGQLRVQQDGSLFGAPPSVGVPWAEGEAEACRRKWDPTYQSGGPQAVTA